MSYEKFADDKGMLAKRAMNGEDVTDDKKRTLSIVNIVFAVLCLISSVVAFIVAGAYPEEWSLRLLVATNYRDSATVESDFYPTLTINQSRTIDLGFVAAAISLGAALGHVVSWIFMDWQRRQMMGGSNPFVWYSFMLWHPIIFLLVAPLAGFTDVYALVLIVLAVLGWLYLLKQADRLNSYSYQFSQHKAGVAAWSWLDVVDVFVVALTVFIVIVIYAFVTFSADGFTAAGISTGYYITLVIVHLALYLANPLIFVAWKAGWISSMYMREMTYYIFNGIFAIVSTWLTLGLFRADSVTITA